ncbi:MAG: hypothetical protein IRY99_04825 [Isosphaeraceae bacterium]|nr:hypothetical protein [Isosphaeraceae bacterium]
MTPPRDPVEALRRSLDARAAGLWCVAGDRLQLAAFAPAPDLPAAVAEGFARATDSVGLDQTSLGIVQAAMTARPAVSVAAALPAEVGSGRWLRAFGASRSVAVPLGDSSGRVVMVLSVALPEGPDGDEVIAERVWQFGQRLPTP